MIDMMDPYLRLCKFSVLAHDEPSPAVTGEWLYGYGTDCQAMIGYDLLSMIGSIDYDLPGCLLSTGTAKGL